MSAPYAAKGGGKPAEPTSTIKCKHAMFDNLRQPQGVEMQRNTYRADSRLQFHHYLRIDPDGF